MLLIHQVSTEVTLPFPRPVVSQMSLPSGTLISALQGIWLSCVQTPDSQKLQDNKYVLF